VKCQLYVLFFINCIVYLLFITFTLVTVKAPIVSTRPLHQSVVLKWSSSSCYVTEKYNTRRDFVLAPIASMLLIMIFM